MMDTRLTQTEKIIYGFIAGFHVNRKPCYASNAYIAQIVTVSERQVSRSIAGLEDKGWIEISNPKGRSRCLACKYVSPDTEVTNLDTNVQEPRHQRPAPQTSTSSNNIDNNLEENKLDNIENKEGNNGFRFAVNGNDQFISEPSTQEHLDF